MTRAQLLLTRPEKESLETLKTLQAAGFSACISPILTIHLNDVTLPTESDAVIATSQHAIAAVNTPLSDPLYVVGDASAALAKTRGWGDIRVAPKGEGESLIQRIKQDYPEPATFTYIRGVNITHDMAFRLGNFNHEVSEIVAYEAEAAEHIEDDIIAELPQMNCVLFYSLRSVEIFQDLTSDYDLSHMTALCISKHTATVCDAQKWAQVLVSDAPNAESIIDKLRETY